MYAGFYTNTNNQDQNQNQKQIPNPESLEAIKNAEKKLSPEEQAAREQAATEWQEKLGVEPSEEPDFESAMADVPPFGAASQNTDNEQQRTPQNATEKAAQEQIANERVDIKGLVQDVSSDAIGGKEIIARDADAASTNMEQAQRAADGLTTKIAAGESDGMLESEHILNAAMVSAAGMKVKTEKTATEMAIGHPNAEISKNDAEQIIEETESLNQSVKMAAEQVQDPELAATMRRGVSDVEKETAKARALLNQAETDAAEEATEEEEQSTSENPLNPEDNENSNVEVTPGQPIATPDAINEMLSNNTQEIDPDTLKNLREKGAEDTEAKVAVANQNHETDANAAADEDLSKRRAVYG